MHTETLYNSKLLCKGLYFFIVFLLTQLIYTQGCRINKVLHFPEDCFKHQMLTINDIVIAKNIITIMNIEIQLCQN